MANASVPTFYATPGREPSQVLGRAFAYGCGGELAETRLIRPGPCAFYGVSKYTAVVKNAAEARGQDYYYIDNGYFKPGHYGGYYRITKNAAQVTTVKDAHPLRWERLGLRIKPWRKQGGDFILVIMQSKTYFELRGMKSGVWLWETVAEINRHTDRQIVVRPKPTSKTQKRDLSLDLKRAHRVVAHTSNVATEALLEGIPVVVTGDCAASPLASHFDEMETRVDEPDRERWAHHLAENQWTLDEINMGTYWAMNRSGKTWSP